MWVDLEKPWQEALKLAWDAYKNGTIPIGCVIVSKDGEIVSRGRNQIFDMDEKNILAGTNMAHAEMNALLGIKEKDHPEIRNYILYTTMEPCPMCFGTAVMMNIRNICYGAMDGFAGATVLNDKLDYIKAKGIKIHKGTMEIEAFQLILQSAHEYERKHPRVETILNKFREVNRSAIDCGRDLNTLDYFHKAAKDSKPVEVIYDEVISFYQSSKISSNQ